MSQLFRMSEERARYLGIWYMKRFTVCAWCDRYTHTTSQRMCKKCWDKYIAIFRWLSGWTHK